MLVDLWRDVFSLYIYFCLLGWLFLFCFVFLFFSFCFCFVLFCFVLFLFISFGFAVVRMPYKAAGAALLCRRTSSKITTVPQLLVLCCERNASQMIFNRNTAHTQRAGKGNKCDTSVGSTIDKPVVVSE